MIMKTASTASRVRSSGRLYFLQKLSELRVDHAETDKNLFK